MSQSIRARIFATVAASAAIVAVLSPVAPAQSARDFINVVGSSTVYPFTTTVAEKFGRQGRFKTPKVESTGTGGGIKLFCNGVGPQHADVVNASRRMNASEFDTCRKNGVRDILEVRVGYDGLTLSESKRGPVMNLTRKQVYLALAKQIPDPANPTTLIANPYTSWNQIDKSLPATKIEVLGPPPTSGTRDSFNELYMEAGCRTYPWLNTLRGQDEKRFKRVCHTLREDGAFVEAGENDNLIVQKIEANRNAIGIFGFSFLEENMDQVKGASVNGVIPGLQEFVNEYVSDKALGEEGYLSDRGLVAQPKSDLARTRADVKSLKNFAP